MLDGYFKRLGKGDSGLELCGGSGEKWMDLGYILEIKLLWLVDDWK